MTFWRASQRSEPRSFACFDFCERATAPQGRMFAEASRTLAAGGQQVQFDHRNALHALAVDVTREASRAARHGDGNGIFAFARNIPSPTAETVSFKAIIGSESFDERTLDSFNVRHGRAPLVSLVPIISSPCLSGSNGQFSATARCGNTAAHPVKARSALQP